MMQMTNTVKQLLILNVIFFIGSQMVPAAYPILSLYMPMNENFRIWQPLTSMFMHAPIPSLMHIVFNMFALVSFGSALEHFWGAKKFVFFYISCGLGAALLHIGVNYLQYHNAYNAMLEAGIPADIIGTIARNGSYNQQILDLVPLSTVEDLFFSYNNKAVGASGAIYGLLTAFAFMFPNAELALLFIPVPIKAKYFVPGMLLLDLVLGFGGSSIFGSGGSGVAHFAHLGGALFGFIMMWYWKKNQFNNNRWN
jgi:membrane associated rhomboid family serine protease